ncbi:hypothetical protein [Salinimicrobium soli]|uniref:hypothetical protein n=1 Tax=Salinimicrobium soli TaxID=1254399 RepID=UPI003AAFBCA5
MNKFLFLFFIFVISVNGFAQEKEIDPPQIISFDQVEQPPLSKRCKPKGSAQKQRDCTSSYINNYVNRNFDLNMASKLVKGLVKLEARFVIDKEGRVKDVSASGGPKKINEHLEEVLASLRDFKPGRENGIPVEVSYWVPVTFMTR